MRIAFDIDDTIAKFTDKMMQYAQIFDKQESKTKRGIIDYKNYITQGMYDWTDDEKERYLAEGIYKSIPLLRPINEAIGLIRALKKEGDEIYFVSARGYDGYSRISQTKKWLKEHDIPYDKLIAGNQDKTEALKENKIDILIDDRKQCCEMAEKAGIMAIQPLTNMTWRELYHTNASWKEIYRILLEKRNKKSVIESYPIIVDTDVTNEIDDEFALAYLLTLSNVNIEAITIAPHFQMYENDINFAKNVENSYKKALEIVNLTKPSLKNKIFKGAEGVVNFGTLEVSEGVKKIIEVCRKHDKVVFISLGCVTNLAHALMLAPDIADKIKLYSLIGDLTPLKLTAEFNMSGDFPATKIVMSKIKDATIFPMTGFSGLVLTKDEIKLHLKKDNKLMNLLYEDFVNITDNKFGCRYKSIFDFILIYYLICPIEFTETECSVKTNTTHILFKKGKGTKVVCSIRPDKPLTDLLSRIENVKCEVSE